MWRSIQKGPYKRPMIPVQMILECRYLNHCPKCLSQTRSNTLLMLMYGSDVTNHIRHSRLMDEFDKFAAKEGESLESVYKRLTTLVNIMDLSYGQLYDSLVQFEQHVQASKAKRAARNHDPLALIAHLNASSSQSHASTSYSHAPQPCYVTHPSLVVDYEEDYQGELQGDSQEDKHTTAMMLLARAVTQKFSTPTNNHLRTTSNTRNQAVIQDGRVDIQTKNAGYGGNVDDNGVKNPNYDEKAVSEVNASHKMIPKGVHEHKNHRKHKTVFNTSDDDQTDSNIIFDDLFVENNGGSDEHDSTAHDQYCDVKILCSNYKETCDELEREIRADKDTIERILKENDKIENIVDLEEKLSSHDRIVYKMGQSIQTIHMLGKTPNKVYDPFLKAGLGYKNSKRLKKAIAAQPKMYHSEMLYSTKLNIDSPNSEETLEDAKEKFYKTDVILMSVSLSKTLKELQQELIEKGRNTYARALVEVSSLTALKESLVVAIPLPNDEGHTLETVDIEYKWQPPQCETCKIFDHWGEDCPKRVKAVDTTPTETDDGFIQGLEDAVPPSSATQMNNEVLKALEDDEEEVEEVFIEKNPYTQKNKGASTPSDLVKKVLCSKVFKQWQWTSNGLMCSKGSRIILGWNLDIVNVVVVSFDAQLAGMFSFRGYWMFRIVKRLKMLKKPLWKLLFDQGNIHDNVKKLRHELDTVQIALDLEPNNSELREDEAASSF
ncbi:hypothetical protein Tco_0150150 [Tanacetum coccineum]